MQILNAIYFGIACALLFFLAPHGPKSLAIPATVVASAFSLLAVAALFAMRNRPTSVTAYELPKTARRLLRASALLVPFVAVCAVAPMAYCNMEYDKGVQLFNDDNYDEAKICFDHAIAIWPEDQSSLSYRAHINNDQERYKEALLDADRAIALCDTDAYSYSERAWALDRMNRFEEAYDAATISIRLDNTDGRPYNSLSDAAYMLGKYDEALAAGNKHCELHDNCSQAFEMRAVFHEELGHLKAAELDRQRAAELNLEHANKLASNSK